MLTLDRVTAGYGDVVAIEQISFAIEKGTTFALLGANGAGKSTTIRTIAGHVKPKSGSLSLNGKDLTNVPTSDRVGLGIALVPEGRKLFSDLSVAENLVVGGYSRIKSAQQDNMDRVTGHFPRLGERFHQKAGSLSGGEQQMLAIGRALMAEPDLLLIDELSLGLMPKVIDDCYTVINDLREVGLTILLVEQNTERALDIAEQVCILESGRISWTGTAQDARGNQDLVQSLLGLSTG